mmetsp:Transcript_17290/g.55048  ORF Transcript_17290/g.55048 Transcript_17290/m.55048 type:complete len:210 (+) Transcript_17290:411-1040(+)
MSLMTSRQTKIPLCRARSFASWQAEVKCVGSSLAIRTDSSSKPNWRPTSVRRIGGGATNVTWIGLWWQWPCASSRAFSPMRTQFRATSRAKSSAEGLSRSRVPGVSCGEDGSTSCSTERSSASASRSSLSSRERFRVLRSCVPSMTTTSFGVWLEKTVRKYLSPFKSSGARPWLQACQRDLGASGSSTPAVRSRRLHWTTRTLLVPFLK